MPTSPAKIESIAGLRRLLRRPKGVSLFHASATKYEVGQTITAGNWGRGYQSYDPARHQPGNWVMLARELLMEKIRKEEFQKKPSRLKSSFSCLSEEELQRYLSRYKMESLFRYEVKLSDPKLPLHIGDYSLCHWQSGETYLDMAVKSQKYWRGEILYGKELLSLSDLKIISII